MFTIKYSHKEKRPIIGEIVTRLSDFVIFTSDNPRTENPNTIINDTNTVITYGIILWFFALNGNNGQPISGLDKQYKEFIGGTLFRLGGVAVPMYVLYAVVLVAFLGIKYMLGSAEEKAEYKKDMIPYLVGAFLLFG